VTCDQPR